MSGSLCRAVNERADNERASDRITRPGKKREGGNDLVPSSRSVIAPKGEREKDGEIVCVVILVFGHPFGLPPLRLRPAAAEGAREPKIG